VPGAIRAFARRHRTRPPRGQVARHRGRTAVVYTRESLGAGWKTYDLGVPCMMHDDDALALSVNILLYAFMR
jgi:hypothetical protein